MTACVFVSAPDGELNLIPFGVLIDTEDRFLIERYQINYLTTGRDLLRIATSGAVKEGPSVFAAPDLVGVL